MFRAALTTLLAMQISLLFAVDTNVVKHVGDILRFSIVPDVVPNSYAEPDFSTRYGRMMADFGCSSNEVLSAVAFLATNRCADVGALTDEVAMVLQRCAIDELARYDFAHEYVGALYYAVTNNAGYYAFNETAALVGALGMGHGAFVTYTSILRSSPESRGCDLTGAVCMSVKKGAYPLSVTNRTVGLFLEALALRKCSPAYADMALCNLWDGYATSSNRLVHLTDGLSPNMPDFITSYLEQKKSILLALPPGTMQMLPTNQFYNVDD